MRAIDPTLVEEVWREMTTYPPERAEEEAVAFLRRQPHVAAFCHSVTKQFDENVQKAGLGLAFLLFKILEASLGAPFPPVARERVLGAYEATTAWLEQQEGMDPRVFLQMAMAEGESAHPNLVRHLMAVFYGDAPERAAPDVEVAASLFLMLKTLCDALDIGPVEEE